MADINGIKMNGQTLTTFNAGGGDREYTYVLCIDGKNSCCICLKSRQNREVGDRIEINEMLDAFELLPREPIFAFGDLSSSSAKTPTTLFAYFTKSNENTYLHAYFAYDQKWLSVSATYFVVLGKR